MNLQKSNHRLPKRERKNAKLVGQKLGELDCCYFDMIYVTFMLIVDFFRGDLLRFYFISIGN